MIVLDTVACIDYLNGDGDLKSLLGKQEDFLLITAITIYEINIGLEKTRRKISEERYRKLNNKWIKFISGMQILALGFKEAKKSAEIYDELVSKGQIIDDNDILIAGIMLANGIIKIITRNIDHFNRIASLDVLSY